MTMLMKFSARTDYHVLLIDFQRLERLKGQHSLSSPTLDKISTAGERLMVL